MSTLEQKWTEAVTTLVLLTQEENLRWEKRSPSEHFAPDLRGDVGVVYFAEYKDKFLRLYEERYRLPPNTVRLLFARDAIGLEQTRPVLEIADEIGNGLWRVPNTHVIGHLLKTVQYFASGASGLLDELLEEPIAQA